MNLVLKEKIDFIYLTVAVFGLIQLALLFRNWSTMTQEDWQIDQYEPSEEININISIWNLFKAFKSSGVLILIYVFYSVIMMHYEINHNFSNEEATYNFVSIPAIYMFITLFLDVLLKRFKNLNILTILLLFVQIIFAIMDVVLRLYNVTDVFSFVIFAVNMILFQKLVFVHINITLVRIFDITNVRVRNYLNCILSSDDQQHPVLRKHHRVLILHSLQDCRRERIHQQSANPHHPTERAHAFHLLLLLHFGVRRRQGRARHADLG
jgi:hypothetical protein